MGRFFDAFDFLVEAQGDAAVPQVVAKCLDHFGVGKLQQPRAFLDERDADAQRREDASVLDADHAAAHDNHGFGHFRHAKDVIAIDDGPVVERDERRNRRFRARSDDDIVRLQFGLSAGIRYLNLVRIDKAGCSREDVDAIAGKLRASHIDFRLDDVERAKGEIGHGDRFLHAIIDAVDALVLVAGKMQDGLTNGLAGNRTGIDGGSADHLESFNERGAFAELGCLDGGALACGPGTNCDEIVLFHGSPREYIIDGITQSLLTGAWRSAIILKIRFVVAQAFRPEVIEARSQRSVCGYPSWRRAARATSLCSRPSGPASSLMPALEREKRWRASPPSRKPSNTLTAS